MNYCRCSCASNRTDQAGRAYLDGRKHADQHNRRRCGATLTQQHGVDQPRLLRHLSILGHPVYLRLCPKRFRCPSCSGHPTTTQHLDWYAPNALHTKAYERHLMLSLVDSTVTDVVEKEDVSYDALLGILDRWMDTSVDWDRISPFSMLGIDEIALLKGHRDFVAVMSARTDGGDIQVLAVLPDRLRTTVANWLMALPMTVRDHITTVCTDLWEGYITAIQEMLPLAKLVVDRFHVARHYRSGVDTLRKQELRRLRNALPKSYFDELKHTLWPFRKRSRDLDEDEQARLDTLLAYSPQLQKAYTPREELTVLFDTARSKADGLRRLRYWKQRYEGLLLLLFTARLWLVVASLPGGRNASRVSVRMPDPRAIARR